jgi:hypothetical protein
MTTEPKKQLQFRDIMARLEELSAKVDELLRRTAPNETKLSPVNEPVESSQVRVDPNLGSL